MSAAHTPGPWVLADVPGAGLQIRGPYKDSTRLMFSDIWRQFPEREWDATMIANAQLAAAAPELLEALQNLLKVHEGEGGTTYHAGDIARAAIAKATGATE